MKDFKQYLVEATQEYKFKVKLALPLEDSTTDMIERVLGKYDVVDITKPKTTPIQEHPMDFQNLRNAEVTMFEVTLNYPTTPATLHQDLVNLVGIPGSHLVVINSAHPEEVAREEKVAEDDKEYVSKLESDYESGEAPKEYKLGFIKEIEKETPQFEIAGKGDK